MMADNAGFDWNIGSRDEKRWNDASRIGFMEQDHRPMARLLQSRLKPYDPTSRRDSSGKG
jgi:hypothetical protein